jgi:hypothetical protein
MSPFFYFENIRCAIYVPTCLGLLDCQSPQSPNRIPIMISKRLIPLIFIFFSSFSYSKDRKVDFQFEIELYVKKLNSLFGVEVKIRKAREDLCFFGSGKIENDWTIIYCHKDFALFENLPVQNNGLNKLLTLIGHEYSHILLDLTMTKEALAIFEQSLDKSAQLIESEIMNDPTKVKQLKMVLGLDRPQLKDSIKLFLGLLHHENMDALGIKITEMANYKADPYWPILTTKFIGAAGRPELELWISPRINNMKEALKGELKEWLNFNCIGNAYTFRNSNLILREGLARFGEIGLLRDLDSGCSTEEVVKTFYEKLNSYTLTNLH